MDEFMEWKKNLMVSERSLVDVKEALAVSDVCTPMRLPVVAVTSSPPHSPTQWTGSLHPRRLNLNLPDSSGDHTDTV